MATIYFFISLAIFLVSFLSLVYFARELFQSMRGGGR